MLQIKLNSSSNSYLNEVKVRDSALVFTCRQNSLIISRDLYNHCLASRALIWFIGTSSIYITIHHVNLTIIYALASSQKMLYELKRGNVVSLASHLWAVPVALSFNPLSTNSTKWSNTLKQFVGNLSTNRLSVFDHFEKLALKRLRTHQRYWTCEGWIKVFIHL